MENKVFDIISWVDFNLTSLLKGVGLQATENMSLRALQKIMSVRYDTGKAEILVLQTIHTYSTQLNASRHQMKDDSFVMSSIAKAFYTIQGTIPVKFCSRTKYLVIWLLHNQFVLGNMWNFSTISMKFIDNGMLHNVDQIVYSLSKVLILFMKTTG